MAGKSPSGRKNVAGSSGRVLRLRQVKDRTGLGHDSVYRLMREGRFPQNFKLSERAAGWLESEIDEWIERHAALRNSEAVS